MSIFDTHAHYLSSRFDSDRDELLKSLFSSGVSGIIECATDEKSIEAARPLARGYDGMYFAAGIHPHSADEYSPKVESRIRELSADEKCVAVGEIGLDYHYDFHPRELQKSVLSSQLALAKELGLPVILHSRESTADMLGILKELGVSSGVMHCFSGSPETAKILLDMGFYIGVGGSLTFKGAVKAVETVRMLPVERLLLETDCPYMTPVPHRGERNDSGYIRIVAGKIGEIKGMSPESVIEAARENALALFGIKK